MTSVTSSEHYRSQKPLAAVELIGFLLSPSGLLLCIQLAANWERPSLRKQYLNNQIWNVISCIYYHQYLKKKTR